MNLSRASSGYPALNAPASLKRIDVGPEIPGQFGYPALNAPASLKPCSFK